MEDLRSVGESSCNCGVGTEQRVQSLMFMMLMNNFNQLNMFRAIFHSSSGALDCVYSLWYNAPTMLSAGGQPVTNREHRRCFLPQQSLLLLRMGEIIAQNMLSSLKLLIKLLYLHPVGSLCYCLLAIRLNLLGPELFF